MSADNSDYFNGERGADTDDRSVQQAFEMRGLAAVSTLLLFCSVSSQNNLQEELANRVEQFVQGTAYVSECGDIDRQAKK